MASYTYSYDDLEKQFVTVSHPAYPSVKFMVFAIYLPFKVNGSSDTITINDIPGNVYLPLNAFPTIAGQSNSGSYNVVNIPNYTDSATGTTISCTGSISGNFIFYSQEWKCTKYSKSSYLITTSAGYYPSNTCRFQCVQAFFDSENHWIGADYSAFFSEFFTPSTDSPNLYEQGTSTASGSISINDGTLESLHLSRRAETVTTNLYDLYEITSLKPFPDPYNPYNGGDESDDPGDGNFEYTGDEIPIPDLPSISVCDSGFVSLFAPTETQLKALSDFMWSDSFSLDSFKKLFNDPMDCILGLSIVPVNIPTGSAREITVGNIVSTVSCDVVTSQFVSVDCGTLTISPTQFSGSYLDYAPYVKAYLYLPFIGVQPLNIDDVMNSTLHIVYHVDILTGACVCYVQATNRRTGGVSQPDAVLYTYMGQCSEPVPLSSQSYSGALSAIMQTAGIAGVTIGTVATGGASAPAAAAALTGLAGSTARTATSMKPSVQHGGSLMGSSGFMCTLYPYMIFDCPHTAIPTKQYAYTGFPSNKIVKLSSLSGFNVVQAVNLTVDGATGTEMEEIKNYLETGVII